MHAPAGAFIAGVIYHDWNLFRRIRCEPDAVLIYRRLLRTDKYTLSTTEEQKNTENPRATEIAGNKVKENH
ncbi:hypothetical protein AB28_5495 [Raoultella ornithinolytica 2-156-04_S1_C2]|nr:hypothetical protein AB00_5504 [Raoultella ornithinolytica 2-156-04_S1_C1]KDX09010.1 hypothetical protein AB28_5495 [Raoultella ornithinolytica 2-156-04_S1_C2]